MKIALIHPYKHHSYNTVKSLKKLNGDLEVFYGYYNKNNIIYRYLEKYNKNNIIAKFLGYNDYEIDEFIKVSMKSKLLFLFSKLNNKRTEFFLNNFRKESFKKCKDKDIYVVFQDYCSNIIDYAYENNKIIIYDQIMPAGKYQRELLIEEAKKRNFSMEYVNKFLSEEKIKRNYKNIEKASIILNASKASYKITEEVLGKEKAKEKSFIIPYGSNLEFLEKKQFDEYLTKKNCDLKSRKLKILYVGSISLAKGIGYLIEVAKSLKEDVEFGVIGVPNKSEDNILLNELEQMKNVYYYGHVPHKLIKEIYMKYDIFIFTSIIEGFGMVTLEAMSMGVPCIVNKYCSSVITNNYDGIIIDNINANEYIIEIKKLINDKNKLKYLSVNAYETAKKYNWNKYVNDLTDILIDKVGNIK